MPTTKKKSPQKPVAKRPAKRAGPAKAKVRTVERNKPAARRSTVASRAENQARTAAHKSAASKKTARPDKTKSAKAHKPPKGRAGPAQRPLARVKAPAPPKPAKAAVRPARAPAPEKPKLKVVARSTAPAPAPLPAPPKPREESAVETSRKLGFQVGDHVVYPSHGVGKIVGIESHTVGEQALQMFVISFEKERMTLRVPVAKITSAGMRRLSSPEKMDAAVSALKGRVRARRVMWSRRAQEYEAKLNSGDPVSIAEVVRDLHRNVGQPDQSYSERQMYEAALERLAREFAAVQKIDPTQAAERLEKVLRAA